MLIKVLSCGRFGDNHVINRRIEPMEFALACALYEDAREDDALWEDVVAPLLDGKTDGMIHSAFSDALWDKRYRKEMLNSLKKRGYFATAVEEGQFAICDDGLELELKAEMARIEMNILNDGEDW